MSAVRAESDPQPVRDRQPATADESAAVLPDRVSLLQQVEKQLARLPLARLSTVAPRTARWAWTTARHGIDDASGVPRIRATAALAAHVAVDESLLALAGGPHRSPRRDDYLRMSEELSGMVESFERRGWLENPAAYHPTPPPLTDGDVRTGRGWALGERYLRLEWDSDFEIHPEVPGADRWWGYEANRTACAWVLERRDRPRPWVVLIHGLGSGTTMGDLMAFRASHLHHDLGFNVAAIVLPIHGPRRVARVGGEEFLGYDQVNALHGLTHSLWDIRRLISWVRGRGATSVAVHGMSLGGYLTALVSCFEDGIDTAIAGIPASDFPRLFRDHAPAHVQRRLEQHGIVDMAAVAHRVVSPLALAPLVPTDRRFIYAGLGDRLTPPDQASRLWDHWDRPEMCWFPGSHLGFAWSPKVARFVDRALVSGAMGAPAPAAA